MDLSDRCGLLLAVDVRVDGRADWQLSPAPPVALATVTPDPDQQRVVDHPGGPLLVLAGPGTGKTTTLVEAVAARVEAGLSPEQVLVLTFSRRAATELRERITARLGRPLATPAAFTVHSWCYAWLRSLAGAAGLLRLLSAPEQDVAVRTLLAGESADDGGVRWPEFVRPALGTRGLAEEVRALLARARELGLSAGELADIGRRAGRADWAAAGRFFEDYLDVLDAQGAIDYSELVYRAALLAGRPELGAGLRERYRAVFVDEYQDTDPAQERLLQALAGGGADLTVVGDPDQAIYGFRGATVDGLLQFPDRFPDRAGRPARVLALGRSRRAGPTLLAVSRHLVAGRVPLAGLPAAVARTHRELRSDPALPPGRAEVCVYVTESEQAAAVADWLRRRHLVHGVAWERMAVLVRSGTQSIGPLRRALTAAAVPVWVAGDELPLAREPACEVLIGALRVAADPGQLTTDRARQLLLSPLGGTDPAGLRRLGRELREAGRSRGEDLPLPSDQLIARAVTDPSELGDLPEPVTRGVRRVAQALARCREALPAGPEEALWALWSGSGWQRRLVRASTAGGLAGQVADRDLDAVVALFDALGRGGETGAGRGLLPLLDEIDSQQIPANPLSDRAGGQAGVRLLTAHRSKGLEWDAVAVVGVQEGRWPDLRRRGSLLEADRLGPQGFGEPPSRAELLIEERRLLYVAVTRARHQLLVTAVRDGQEDGLRPSRLLGELGLPVQEAASPGPEAAVTLSLATSGGSPSRALRLPAVVADLRRVLVAPGTSAALRSEVARRLAGLALQQRDNAEPLAPGADPAGWWGVVDLSDGETPVRRADQPLSLSATALDNLQRCPLQWFLSRELGAGRPREAEAGFGSLVHAIADAVTAGELAPDLARVDVELSAVWPALGYPAQWKAEQERRAALAAVERFLVWHRAARGRTVVGSEVGFSVELDVGGRPVRLSGEMDRVEIDADGRVHVVDWKTGKTVPTKNTVEADVQLAAYQLAVARGGVPAAGSEAGGAQLVYLRADAPPKAGLVGGPAVRSQAAPAPGPASVLDPVLDQAVQTLSAEDFPATPSDACPRCAFARACPAQPQGRQVIT